LISSKTYIALTKFGIVGGLSFVIDISVYYFLSQFLPTSIAKSIGILVATYVNYQLNKHWTWGQKNSDKGRLVKYLALYAVSGITNVGTN
jgi:putative flippase GtrA